MPKIACILIMSTPSHYISMNLCAKTYANWWPKTIQAYHMLYNRKRNWTSIDAWHNAQTKLFAMPITMPITIPIQLPQFNAYICIHIYLAYYAPKCRQSSVNVCKCGLYMVCVWAHRYLLCDRHSFINNFLAMQMNESEW